MKILQKIIDRKSLGIFQENFFDGVSSSMMELFLNYREIFCEISLQKKITKLQASNL